jgi:hypothetical protein
LHELFHTFLCSANLGRNGRSCSKCGRPGEVGERLDFQERWNAEVIIEPFTAFWNSQTTLGCTGDENENRSD